MNFEEILDHAMAMLQRRGRVTYRALQRQFQLDDAALDDLKEQLLYAHPQVVDDAGRGLIWTGATVSVPAADAVFTHVSPRLPLADISRPRDESLGASPRVVHHAVLRLYEDLVSALLQREGRVSYRSLMHLFGFDAACLDHVRQELIFKQLARDAHGEGLEWTGSLPRVAQTNSRHAEPTDAGGEIVSAPLDEVPVLLAAPVRPAPEAERRQLTVLFCDLVGSTQLSGQLDPEDLRAVVRAYQEAAAEVIQHYEGHIAQYLGDGLLVYFGYPAAHEDDARRAVHTGLGIVQAIATLNTRLAAQYGVPLAVRLGIHTGPVVVGVMGGGGRHEHLALGETPNIAARLQALAPANAVVISAVTARLVQGTFALEDLGPYALPGVAEPLAVSRVRGLLATPSRDDEFYTNGVPLLVGREEESGLLRRRWEQSKAGLGQVVFVSGEAGIGKSALVERLRAQVRAEGLPRITYRCSPYHTNSALYPVITHLERLLQFEPDDPPTTRLAKLEAGLRPYDLPLAEVVPVLAGLLSVPLPAERYAALTLTPPQQKQQTLDTLVAWLEAEAERQPVLVAWEDLHWADPTTLEVLGLVIEQAPTVPMLHVLTYRPEFSPPWPPRSHMTPLVLNRLERPQVEALIAQRAGQHASERSAHVEAISHFTTGIELLKSLPETPARIQQALTLYTALGSALQIAKGLAAPEVEHAYTQAHALCQQVGETPQLVPVLFGLWRFYVGRPQLHTARDLGDTLLRLAQRADDPTLAVIAHYALGATRLFLGALPAACQHLEAGIARYTPDQRRAPVFRTGQDPGVACRAYAAMTLWLLGYPDQALEHTHDALALAQELSHPFSLAFARGWAAVVSQCRRDVPAVHEHAEAAVALATEQGFTQWAARGTSLYGWALAMQGQGEAGLAQVRQGIAAWQATGAALVVPFFCTLLADVCDHLGHTEDGLQALAEAHTLMEQHDERWWEAEVCRLRGVLLLRQPGTAQAEAEAWLQRALDVARRQEAKSLELRAAMSLSRLWQQQGKRAEAHELLAPVYGWFTEGFDTADLQEAKVLLDELG